MDIPQQDPENFYWFNNFMPLAGRQKMDPLVDIYDVLYIIETGDVIYSFVRVTMKKILMIKGKELIFVDAFKKLDDGTWIEVYVSYDDINFPTIKKLDRMTIELGGLLFENGLGETEPDNEDGALAVVGTRCTKFTLLEPQTRIPVKVVKGMMGSYFKTYWREQAKLFEEYRGRGVEDWRAVAKDMGL